MRCCAWERSATSRRWARSPRCSARRRPKLQPTVAAAICLLGVNCSSHLGYLQKMLGFADGQSRVTRSWSAAPRPASARSAERQREALNDAVRRRHSVAGSDARAAGAGRRPRSALRNTPLMLKVLEAARTAMARIGLLAEGSTCSKRISRRSSSSSPCGGATGPPPTAPARADCPSN